jgi:hypothetical protein
MHYSPICSAVRQSHSLATTPPGFMHLYTSGL